MYVYLGAEDCLPCREYTKFLSANRPALEEAFSTVIVVDIRTWLKGPPLIFKVGEKRFSFAAFNALVGDSNTFLTYPYFWFISPATLKQSKQLPRGAHNYSHVAKQLDILRVQ